jgi:hypothetical protein
VDYLKRTSPETDEPPGKPSFPIHRRGRDSRTPLSLLHIRIGIGVNGKKPLTSM